MELCHSDELAESQKISIQKYLNVPAQSGDRFFLVNLKWWDHWKRFSNFNSDIPNGDPSPGPIDNSDLLGEGALKPNLLEGEHYHILPQEAWEAVHSWYGGGPAISKLMVETGVNGSLQVEVYQLSLEIGFFGGISLNYHPIKISRAASLFELALEITKFTPLPVHKIYLHIDINGEGEWKLVSEPGDPRRRKLTLDEAGIMDGSYVIGVSNPNVQIPDFIDAKTGLETLELPSPPPEEVEDGDEEDENPTPVVVPKPRSYSRSSNSSSSANSSSSGSTRSKQPIAEQGVCGLSNLGNTCFMNSALQCLSNTSLLTTYFLDEKYISDLNRKNPIGTGGKLAEEYFKLLSKMWAGHSSVVPKEFKWTIGRFATQFNGYRQHDSQELLAFLLDGLHEDLNRVKEKPYVALKELKGPDEVVALESWKVHLSRNQSIIVDLFQGQLKSKLVCPDKACENVSITFDPFLYLSLPLPSAQSRTISITYVAIKKPTIKTTYQIRVDSKYKISVLHENLAKEIGKHGCPPESICLADVSEKAIWTVLNLEALVSTIQPADDIYAFQVRPLVTGPIDPSMTRIIHVQFAHRLPGKTLLGSPFILSVHISTQNNTIAINDFFAQIGLYIYGKRVDISTLSERFCVVDDHNRKILPNLSEMKFIPIKHKSKWVIEWFQQGVFQESMPFAEEETKPSKLRNSVSIFDCLQLFLKSEKLSKNDEWQCTKCHVKHQADKKFDLWKMPQVLVIHLKRFQYDRWGRNKIDTLVDFPIAGLDLSDLVMSSEDKKANPPIYDLFAASVHSGGLGMYNICRLCPAPGSPFGPLSHILEHLLFVGNFTHCFEGAGHYTAYGYNHITKKWYYFNDSLVHATDINQITRAGVYLLFYQRREKPQLQG